MVSPRSSVEAPDDDAAREKEPSLDTADDEFGDPSFEVRGNRLKPPRKRKKLQKYRTDSVVDSSSSSDNDAEDGVRRREDKNANLRTDEGAVDGPRWTGEELMKLFDSMIHALPRNDAIACGKRVKKLDWDKIAGDSGRSAEECRTRWEEIASKLRTFRLMSELIGDARCILHAQYDPSVKPPIIPQKRKRPKVQRKPNYPKQPKKPYMLFRGDVVAELRARKIKLRFFEQNAYISEKYKKLTEEERAALQTRYEEGKARFQEAKQKYYENNPRECVKPPRRLTQHQQTRRRGGFKVDLHIEPIDCPTLPASPSELFRKEDEDRSSDDWEVLSKDQRLPYLQAALKDEARYKNEVSASKERNSLYRPPQFRSRVPRAVKLQLQSGEATDSIGRPVRPAVPRNPYHLFLSEYVASEAERKKIGPRWMSHVSEAWRELPETEKEDYQRRVDEMWKKYSERVADYLAHLPEDEREAERQRMRLSKRTISSMKNAEPEDPSSSTSTAEHKKSLRPRSFKKARVVRVEHDLDSDSLCRDTSQDLSSPMKGRSLFVFENERDFCCRFPLLDNASVRDRLGKIFDDLPAQQQAYLNERASSLEEDFL